MICSPVAESPGIPASASKAPNGVPVPNETDVSAWGAGRASPAQSGLMEAVKGSHDRGVWKRTGGRTFEYSFVGTAVNSSGAIVWIRKISGTITMIDDCKTEKITAVMGIYLPGDDPFDGPPLYEFDFGDLYARRLTLP